MHFPINSTALHQLGMIRVLLRKGWGTQQISINFWETVVPLTHGWLQDSKCVCVNQWSNSVRAVDRSSSNSNKLRGRKENNLSQTDIASESFLPKHCTNNYIWSTTVFFQSSQDLDRHPPARWGEAVPGCAWIVMIQWVCLSRTDGVKKINK